MVVVADCHRIVPGYGHDGFGKGMLLTQIASEIIALLLV
jgi:hypothetical protein